VSQDGDDGDPYELDPFGESEYDPSLAFAFVASRQAREHLDAAESFVNRELQAHADRSNQIALSARKSSLIQLADARSLFEAVRQSKMVALAADRASPEFQRAISDTVDRFHELKGVHDQIMLTAAQIAAADPSFPAPASQPVSPSALLEPHPASLKVHADITAWMSSRRGNDLGSTVVVKATPGVGKTHAMVQLAVRDHMSRGRITFAVRTKAMIAAPQAEMRQRILSMSPTGKMALAVIYGRDASNCHRHETVEAVMAHGYAPGPTVCVQCEHYPGNNTFFGVSICPYYEERIAADLIAKGARRGFHRQYPFVLTTHASMIAAYRVQGGRYGTFWGADEVFIDEDPTDSMEVDTALSEEQCSFQSRSRDTTAAGVASRLFQHAVEIARRDRAICKDNQFRAPGNKQPNTHPIHSKYDSSYIGQSLRDLLEQALHPLAVIMNVPSLAHVLRSVTDGAGFQVTSGALAQVTGSDDINALDIPPKSLSTVADAVHSEMAHTTALRRIIFKQTMGRPPNGVDAAAIIRDLEAHTEVEPMSYTVRLECLPADSAKGRKNDEWRFVVREFRKFANTTASVVIGDAYAQKDHYEQLFDRAVDLIDVVSELHPEARFLRVLDSQCNISEMRRGGIQRILALLESQMKADVQRGDRVLFYGHGELRPIVAEWIEPIAAQMGIEEWAFEHWWGGRGKDQYNGWEKTYCLSDPVLSLSGLAHTANARAFRDSIKAKDPAEKLKHAQLCAIGDDRRGAIYALRASHPRIALEHDRMNVAELTQAMHRSRPAHHPVQVVAYGEMEQSPDLIAQVETVIGAASRKRSVSNSRRKARATQDVVTVDTFVTVEEALAAMRAIVAHYGVYSAWFAHALIASLRVPQTVPPVVPLIGVSGDDLSNDSEALGTVPGGVDPVVIYDPLLDDGINRRKASSVYPSGVPAPQPPTRGGARVPGVGQPADDRLIGGSTEPAEVGAVLPNPRTIIERVWHPPAYWRLLIGSRAQPKAIETAHSLLRRDETLSSKVTSSWPKWSRGILGGGRFPMLFFDPKLLPADAALREYRRITENQYGPLLSTGLHRPNAEMQVPGSLSAIPF
jgi:hypothetical protein